MKTQEEKDAAIDAACEAYLATVKPALAKYKAIKEQAQEAYNAIKEPAWAKYLTIIEENM